MLGQRFDQDILHCSVQYSCGPSMFTKGGGLKWEGRTSRRSRTRPEGGTPPAQLGGMGERCKLPHWGLGLRPRSPFENPPKLLKKVYLLN